RTRPQRTGGGTPVEGTEPAGRRIPPDGSPQLSRSPPKRSTLWRTTQDVTADPSAPKRPRQHRLTPPAPLRSRGAEDKARDLQRRRDRDPDHDHGARVAHSGRNIVGGAQARAAGAPGVRAQLRVPRDLLEQPPPHAGRRVSRKRRDAVGEPASPLLAL